MADERDPPIQEQDYLFGVRLVDIGDYRVARGLSRRAFTGCHHHKMVYDEKERRIWCRDCERDVEPFDGFLKLVESFAVQALRHEKREAAIKAAEEHSLFSMAAKAIDKIWRSKRMLPCCPNCNQGIFPEDFKNGVKTMVSRDFAEHARKKKEVKK